MELDFNRAEQGRRNLLTCFSYFQQNSRPPFSSPSIIRSVILIWVEKTAQKTVGRRDLNSVKIRFLRTEGSPRIESGASGSQRGSRWCQRFYGYIWISKGSQKIPSGIALQCLWGFH